MKNTQTLFLTQSLNIKKREYQKVINPFNKFLIKPDLMMHC
jgi:hypothetical protein